jgi:hypothetical protein
MSFAQRLSRSEEEATGFSGFAGVYTLGWGHMNAEENEGSRNSTASDAMGPSLARRDFRSALRPMALRFAVRPAPTSPLIRATRLLVASIILLASYAWAIPPPAVTFNVNDNRDTVDLHAEDGLCLTVDGTCTLRAAVMAANHYIVGVQINLPAGVYTLHAPSGSDGDDTGDLNLVSVLNSPLVIIVGAGAASTIIDGNQTDGVFYIESDRTVNISGVTMRNGKTSSSGGAIYNFGNLALTDVAILTNSAEYGGGLFNNGTAFVTRVAFNGNTAGYGGGIYNFGSLTISQSSFDSNTAGFGAGLANYSSAVASLSHVTLIANKATSYGGGIYNGAELTIADSTLSGNEAVNQGGGIYNSGGSPLEIARSTIMDGKAQQGAGVYNGGGMTVLNTTISQNTSTGFGGGIGNSGEINVYNSTIAYNTAGFGTGISGFGGGASSSPGSTFNVRNTIVAANYSPATGFYDDCNGTLSSYGVNRFLGGIYCVVNQVGPGNHNGLVSLLEVGALKDNGGPTSTIALKYYAFTDLIDALPLGCTDQFSITLATDQRGRPRTVGTYCDIGAFEYDPGDIFANGFQ